MSDADSLKKELAAIKAERERKAAERAAAGEAARLQEQIAREKQAAADDETYAALCDKHGAENLRRINTKHGMVVVTSAEPIVQSRFQDETARSDHPNPKVRMSFTAAAEKFARLCVVHPSREAYDKIAERVSGLPAIAANEAFELGKPQVEEDSGK